MADDTDELKSEKQSVKLSSLPFSQNDRDVIERELNVVCVKKSSLDSIIDVYDIEKTAHILLKNDYKRIALQFPDILLPDSSAVAGLLEEKTHQKVFVLADTSFGSCCVDEVAAEHIKADVIVHYGRACLSPTRRLPVYYVFGKFPMDASRCANHFNELIKDKQSHVIIMYDVVYSHYIENLYEMLEQSYPNIIVSRLQSKTNIVTDVSMRRKMDESYGKMNENEVKKTQESNGNGTLKEITVEESKQENNIIKRFGFEFVLPNGQTIDQYQIFYIGKQSLNLTNLIMTYNKCQFFTYDPELEIARKETLNVNRALMKRYYMIQKAKDAQVVGIAIGTLGVADYLEVIERLKRVLTIAGKKYYTFVMGKLNVAKMANFMEIDIFVLVACPENSLIDSQEFYKPIVTPYEMEIACLRTQEWTGEYITDFRQLLPGASHSADLDDKENLDDDNPPEVSLITGHIRPNYKTTTQDSSSTSVVQRNQETAISTQHHINAAEFLATRSWQGLEQNLGETAVVKAKEGRMGIASGYTHENTDT